MPPTTSPRVFRFGIFEASDTTGELRKEGIRIKLHAQPFRVLLMLLEKPAELVTREEMRQRLWGNETFVDFDHGLNTAINKLREALSDSASQPRYVETVPGRGYRFIASVTLTASLGAITAADAVSTNRPATPIAEKSSPATMPPGRESAVQAPTPAGSSRILTTVHELPRASRRLVAALLLLTQLMYLAFYLGALANLPEIHQIFVESQLAPPIILMTLLVTTAVVLIPVRLYLFAAVCFDFQLLSQKFRRLFPVLLPLDLLWALSPFLLIHHLSLGLALGITAALVYMPFAQRSLVLMYARGQQGE
jgi:cholera toxin transcriptional activator